MRRYIVWCARGRRVTRGLRVHFVLFGWQQIEWIRNIENGMIVVVPYAATAAAAAVDMWS